MTQDKRHLYIGSACRYPVINSVINCVKSEEYPIVALTQREAEFKLLNYLEDYFHVERSKWANLDVRKIRSGERNKTPVPLEVRVRLVEEITGRETLR